MLKAIFVKYVCSNVAQYSVFTFSSGATGLLQLLPSMLSDVCRSVPREQKVNLLDMRSVISSFLPSENYFPVLYTLKVVVLYSTGIVFFLCMLIVLENKKKFWNFERRRNFTELIVARIGFRIL